MSCANNNDVSRNTMKVETFDFFLNEYLGLFGETQKAINECTDKKLCAWAEKEFSALSSSMRKLLVDNLFRIVFPYDNFHRFAHTPAELEDVVQAVEDDFSTEVQKAIDYFGEDFLSDKLDNYYKIGM